METNKVKFEGDWSHWMRSLVLHVPLQVMKLLHRYLWPKTHQFTHQKKLKISFLQHCKSQCVKAEMLQWTTAMIDGWQSNDCGLCGTNWTTPVFLYSPPTSCCGRHSALPVAKRPSSGGSWPAQTQFKKTRISAHIDCFCRFLWEKTETAWK